MVVNNCSCLTISWMTYSIEWIIVIIKQIIITRINNKVLESFLLYVQTFKWYYFTCIWFWTSKLNAPSKFDVRWSNINLPHRIQSKFFSLDRKELVVITTLRQMLLACLERRDMARSKTYSSVMDLSYIFSSLASHPTYLRYSRLLNR